MGDKGIYACLRASWSGNGGEVCSIRVHRRTRSGRERQRALSDRTSSAGEVLFSSCALQSVVFMWWLVFPSSTGGKTGFLFAAALILAELEGGVRD
jgi:hypothetical protein